ncbi:MAG: hypothetical protein V7608_1075, partial [Hyphomicrobiales bacterium]
RMGSGFFFTAFIADRFFAGFVGQSSFQSSFGIEPTRGAGWEYGPE